MTKALSRSHSKPAQKKPVGGLRTSKEILEAAVQALDKPGIARSLVFGTKTSARVKYAYSVNPKNLKQVIREGSDGSKEVGTFGNGRFRPVSKQ